MRAPARLWPVAALALVVVLAAGTSAGAQGGDEIEGRTTVEQRIVPNDDPDFRELGLGPGEPYVVREDGLGTAEGGREARRESLIYFGQLSDFQLADEESPARVELLDFGPFSAAWRPWEALNPQIDDAMVRQLNAFAPASPLAAGDGSRRAMDLAINTGDAADSQQLNETQWVRTLMEGGPLDPGSGVNPATSGDPICGLLSAAGLIADAGSPRAYSGVQDYDDYLELTRQFYDPDQPAGAFGDWPEYRGLMDRAQQPFDAAGLDVPSYISVGNHDGLVQGNAAANGLYETVATGCLKPLGPLVIDPDTLAEGIGAALDPENLLNLLLTDPTKLLFVPPDPKRQFVSKPQYKQVFLGSSQADGHGFAYVDPAEEAESNGTASYYSWSPAPGFRFISLDTVSEAGIIGPSADGNIDDPQYRWLRDELADATAADELVVLFSHHGIPSLTSGFADELAGPCTVDDAHGHDINPGCDLDPRSSSPIHLGPDMANLLHEFPHVIAWVAGHSHVNAIEPHPSPSGEGGFWAIRTAAEADWPQQSRLLEVFDNEDGTLSIFGTILDHVAAATAPGPQDASTFDVDELASVGRTISYNDRQNGGRSCGGGPCGEGDVDDRNVELLVADPREGADPGPGPGPGPGDDPNDEVEGKCTGNVIRGTRGRDRLKGTDLPDTIKARRGADVVRAGDEADCVIAGRGRDRVNGGAGEDLLRGGRGNDRIKARDGEPDTVRCGSGKRDRAKTDDVDSVAGCERVRRQRS